ncbi:PREDICTED: transmembrane and TPR repeat-containing protein 4 isoform X1 [Gekko japonicus]|uniref:dolichyl-phosphate-mannose--protein mannosyltransferase n=1 Tax=Gekko japonicus TaxID=146911 RepID=A0ABM1KA55_GEKJA|nr:PREDICTED: transmembrane and TPR repeat-containing protein 4 isoform X1 [Gekko japonicus]
MAQTEDNLDHDIPLWPLPSNWAKAVVGLLSIICFANSYDGDFVFDDSEAILNNKVAGIVGRADLLCALFFLLSFLGYCRALKESKCKEGTPFSIAWILLSILLGAVAMLCKEQGITILGLNALFDAVVINKLNILEVVLKILRKDKSLESLVVFRKGLLSRTTMLLCGGAAMLYVRWRIMGTGPPAFTEVDNPASFADSLFVRAINYNYYYSLNAWLLLCPWWLCFDWSMGCVPLIKSVTDWRIIALAVLWFCLIALMGQALRSEDSQKRRILTLGLGFLIIPFLPASNLFFRVGFVVAERVTYLPSIGYCMLITYGFSLLSKQAKRKKLLVAALLGLLLINVWRCVIRSNQWRSEEQLFRSALSVCPLNAKVHYNVGKNLADKGNQSAAISYYREAVRLNPKYVHAMNNLGNILKERNELHEAEELLSLAVQIQPDFAAAWMNLGIVQNSLRRYEEAEQSYWTAIRHRKKYPDCYYNLGRLYADLNRHVDALNAWRNATVLKPQHSLAWNNMIILLDNTGNLAQAEAVGREALELIPNDHSLMFSLANVLGKSQKYKESEALFHKAIKANPNAASYHGNLAVLYHRWGNLDLAKKHYEVSLKLDPTAAGTRENYSLLKRKLDQLQKKG